MHAAPYPQDRAGRDQWIRDRRGPRPEGDVRRAQSWFIEPERSANGRVRPVLTALLRSRECPWRCLMCDLWKFTVTRSIPPGAIAAQLEQVLTEANRDPQWPELREVKLYNGGSFFDAGAVPPADHEPVAARLRDFQRVIVECHPSLVNQRVLQFRDRLEAGSNLGAPAQLEVAMGLETVHPVALERLNKRMTLGDFQRAACLLQRERIALRAFVLVQPPFVPATESVLWAERSIDFAFDCGATAVTLIPTRPGNGAIEALAAQGLFTMPILDTLESALARGLARGRGRVFADLWDLAQFSRCPACFPARRRRLETMNHEQRGIPPVPCSCGTGAANENQHAFHDNGL
jgi:archaeosine synthase beta-subunit